MRILAVDTTGTFGSIAIYDHTLVEEIPLPRHRCAAVRDSELCSFT